MPDQGDSIGSAAAIAARLCSILLLLFVVAGLSLRSSRFVGIATRDAASALLAVSVIESISFIPGCFGLDVLSYFSICVAYSVANHTVALLIVGIITVSTGLGICHATSGRIIKRYEVERQYFYYRLYLLACSSLLASVGALLSGQEQHATLCYPAVDSWFLTYSLPALIGGICSIYLHCYSIRKAAELPKLRVWTRDVAGQQGSSREVGDAATTKYVANDSKDSNPNDVAMQADMALVAGVMPRFLAGTAYTASVGTLESAVMLDAGGSLRLPAADTDQTVDGSLTSLTHQTVGNRGVAYQSNRWKKAGAAPDPSATGQASTGTHAFAAQTPQPNQALNGTTARGCASPVMSVDPALEQGSQRTEAPHAVSNVSHVTFGNGSVGSFQGYEDGSATGRRACSFDATSSDIRASNSDNGAKAKEHIIGRRKGIKHPRRQQQDESDATGDAAHRASAPISEAEIGTQVTRRSSFDFGQTRGMGRDGAGAAASGATKLGRRDSGHGSFHGFPSGLLRPGLSYPQFGTSVLARGGEKPHAQSWSSPIPARELSFTHATAASHSIEVNYQAGGLGRATKGFGSPGQTITADSSLKVLLPADASTPSGPDRSLGTADGLKRVKQGPLFEVTGSSSSSYGRRHDLRVASILRGYARSASTPNVSRTGGAADPAQHVVPVQREPGSDQSRRKVRPGQVPDITSLRMTSGLSDDSVEDVSSSSKAGILAATRRSSKPCRQSGSKQKIKMKYHGDEYTASAGGSSASKGRSRSSDARGSSSASSTRVAPSKRRRDSVAAVLGGRSGARRDSPSSLVKERNAADFLHMGRNAPPSLEAVRKELANASTNRRRSTGSFEGSSTTSKVARPSFDDGQNEGGNDSTLPSSLHGSAKLPSGMFYDASVGPNESYSEGITAGDQKGDAPSREQHTLCSMLCDTCCSKCCPCFLPGLRGMMSRDRLQRQYCVAPRLIGMMWVIIPLTIMEVLMDASQLADKGTVSFAGPPMGPDDVDVKESVAGRDSGVMLTLTTLAIALLFGLHKGVICWPCHVFYKKTCCCGAIQCKQSVDEAELSCARCVAAPCGGRDGAVYLFCCAYNSFAKCCGSITGFEECCISECEAQKAIERSRPGYWTTLRKRREQNRLKKQRQGRGSAAAATKGYGQKNKEISGASAFTVRVNVRSAYDPAPAPPQDAARVVPAPAPQEP